jgi:hypothetical protein
MNNIYRTLLILILIIIFGYFCECFCDENFESDIYKRKNKNHFKDGELYNFCAIPQHKLNTEYHETKCYDEYAVKEITGKEISEKVCNEMICGNYEPDDEADAKQMDILGVSKNTEDNRPESGKVHCTWRKSVHSNFEPKFGDSCVTGKKNPEGRVINVDDVLR